MVGGETVSYQIVPAAAAAMLAAGNALITEPTTLLRPDGVTQLLYQRPNVAAIFEAMDAARIANDGLSNAERLTQQLGVELQKRGLDSLDALLASYDEYSVLGTEPVCD